MFQKIMSIGLLAGVMLFTSASTTPSENKYVKSGENLTFTASFSMSGIMTDVAEIKMQTSTVKTKSSELLRLKCTASTYTAWDSFFRVRDLYESYVRPESLLPVLFKRNIEEGTYKKELKYLFKRKSKIAVSTLNKKGFKNRKKNVPINYNTLDIVSAIYNIRTLDYENFAFGKRVTKELVVDSEIASVTVKYVGKENIKVGKYGNKECYKLEVYTGGKELETVKGGKFIWITADDDRLPALIKANVPVGAIKIRLTNYNK